jgi:hypothetical protein
MDFNEVGWKGVVWIHLARDIVVEHRWEFNGKFSCYYLPQLSPILLSSPSCCRIMRRHQRLTPSPTNNTHK